ncbi:sensor histidine kinase [Paenibacillus massiliensis]|uniref:sensor histidine kinase n=1 Tax=Paenibacillus massiliensis TaxID=225917 RepID=UPI0004BAF6CB
MQNKHQRQQLQTEIRGSHEQQSAEIREDHDQHPRLRELLTHMQLRNMPLRYQLILLFLLFAIVPSVGLGALVNWTVERIVERQVESHTLQLIGKVNEALDSQMENLQNMTYLIGFQPEVIAFMSGQTAADGYTGQSAHTAGTPDSRSGDSAVIASAQATVSASTAVTPSSSFSSSSSVLSSTAVSPSSVSSSATDSDSLKSESQPTSQQHLPKAPLSATGAPSARSQDQLYSMKQYLQGFTTLYPEIAGILLVNQQGDYISNDMYPRYDRSLLLEDWYVKAKQNPGIFTVLGQPDQRNLTSHARYQNNELVSIVRSVTDPASGQVLGVILIDLKQRSISQAARNITLGKSGYVMVTDAEGRSIYMPELSPIKHIPPEWFHSGESGGIFTRETEGREMLFMYQASSFTGWQTVGVFPADESVQEVRQIQFYIVSFVFIVCLFGLTASLWLSRSIAQPILQLMSYMRRAEKGDLSKGKWTERADEVGMLGRSYNRMVEQLQQLMQLNKVRERQKREAELRSLQEHIKPHFLYNTLDTIHWMARKQGAADVSVMVGALSRLFRIGLSKGDDYIPLQAETEHVSSYLHIQQMRYRDRLRYELVVPPELARLYLLKLLLQPIVENAIYHGIKARRGPGLIRIEASADTGSLRLTVSDNGAGMSAQRLQEIRELLASPVEKLDTYERRQDPTWTGRSYGMLNVQARLRLSFGDTYGITVDSVEGEGTCVTIIHPLLPDMPTPQAERTESEGLD